MLELAALCVCQNITTFSFYILVNRFSVRSFLSLRHIIMRGCLAHLPYTKFYRRKIIKKKTDEDEESRAGIPLILFTTESIG